MSGTVPFAVSVGPRSGPESNRAAPTETELRRAYAGKRVLLTGHTGFKGSWLTLWLRALGAEVTGYALAPDPMPSLFLAAGVEGACRSVLSDVRDLARLRAVVQETAPDHVFHLAAQPLVRLSYEQPVPTIETNVLGTANVLEAVRLAGRPCAVVVVTSDKCYENKEWIHGYREDEPMGGHDVYSMSKGAAELVVSSYRRSFFHPARLAEHGVAVATARAGNVVGGGDWARDRLVPDAIGALAAGRPIPVRNPQSVRPWQHVLEPLGGYLLLGARLGGVVGTPVRASTSSARTDPDPSARASTSTARTDPDPSARVSTSTARTDPDTAVRASTGGSARTDPDPSAADRARYCEPWNFGPRTEDARPVRSVVEALIRAWGSGTWEDRRDPRAPHEAGLLRLAIDKAHARLGWSPRWGFDETFERTVAWYRAFHEGASKEELAALCRRQIEEYLAS